ncbi:MAG: hypothetical protein ACRD3N_02490 [Terracidiphilus sp.]
MQPILDIVTILCVGLMVGVELSVSAFTNPPVRRHLPGPEARHLHWVAKFFILDAIGIV